LANSSATRCTISFNKNLNANDFHYHYVSSPFVCLGEAFGFVNVYAAESLGGDETDGGEAISLETLLGCEWRESEAQSRFTFILEECSSLRFQLPERAALLRRSPLLMPRVLYSSEANLSNSASVLDILRSNNHKPICRYKQPSDRLNKEPR